VLPLLYDIEGISVMMMLSKITLSRVKNYIHRMHYVGPFPFLYIAGFCKLKLKAHHRFQ